MEGRISAERLSSLVKMVKQRGGLVSTRRSASGDKPYELNISYFDAMADLFNDEGGSIDHQLQLQRFLSSQALMLALQGMPAIYFHSLVGSPNYLQGVSESGINRRINRRKYDRDELSSLITDAGSLQNTVFLGMQRLLRIRRQQTAFHPDANQDYLESGRNEVIAFERHSHSSGQRILVATNVSREAQSMQVPARYRNASDLLGRSSSVVVESAIELPAGHTVWLETRN